jgi:hypothetical protein
MGLSENIWVIAAAIYVLGMFPLFYYYQSFPLDRFGTTITRLTLISIFGAVGVLFIYIFLGAWGTSRREEEI